MLHLGRKMGRVGREVVERTLLYSQNRRLGRVLVQSWRHEFLELSVLPLCYRCRFRRTCQYLRCLRHSCCWSGNL